MNTPLTLYQQQLQQGLITEDLQQHQAIIRLNTLFHQLQHQPRWWQRRPPETHGLYIWGPVGRGKTMLMDLFFDCLPQKQGLRLHFHRFMREVHQQLRAASGQADPLAYVAAQFAQRATVLCFDEFYVDNIGDAMLLGRLLKHLFSHRVVLIATSNQPPSELYPDGLHRDRFLPAIKLLEHHQDIIALNGPEDHRLRHLTPQQSWFLEQTEHFGQLCPPQQEPVLELCHRTVRCIARNDRQRTVWFSFEQLCTGHRCALDYIELSEHFDTLLLSAVPHFSAVRREWIKARGTEDGAIATSTGERKVRWSALDDPARRFISLVDELYDRRVNLIVSAVTHADQLYPNDGPLSFQFQRTLSRLVEMGSLEYQQSPTLNQAE